MSGHEKWNLTTDEAAGLLGIEAATLQEMQRRVLNSQPVVLTNDAVERLSLLLRVWRGLNLFVPQQRQDLAFELFSKPITNPTFNNRSIKDFLLESNSVDAFCEVITFVRAQH